MTVEVVVRIEGIAGPDIFGVGVRERRHFDYDSVFRGKRDKRIESLEKLRITPVEVEFRLMIKSELVSCSQERRDKIGRLGFTRRVGIDRCLQLSKEHKQPGKSDAFLRDIREVAFELERAIDHGAVVLRRGNEHQRFAAEKENFRIVRVYADGRMCRSLYNYELEYAIIRTSTTRRRTANADACDNDDTIVESISVGA